jgi:dipicolinate synthase subunit A
MKLLVLGGDIRLHYTAERLKQKYEVYTYGVSEFDMLPDEPCDAAVLGLPASRDGINISAPLCRDPVSFTVLKKLVKCGGIVIGGMISPAIRKFCAENGFFCEDHYCDEAVMLRNAVPSAEGALAVGINATPEQMLGQKVLILGFGRIASQLAVYLTAMGCEVIVAARSREKRAKARMLGCRAVGFDVLGDILPEVTLIYNTVPCAVIGEDELAVFDDEAVYVELASVSGIDSEALKRHSVTVIKAGGLPAKTAPKTAGEIIADAVEEILDTYKERGGDLEQ